MSRKLIVPIKVYLTVELDNDFDDISEAIESCCDRVFLNNYAGNGCAYGKLIGTDDKGIDLEVGVEPNWEDAEFTDC